MTYGLTMTIKSAQLTAPAARKGLEAAARPTRDCRVTRLQATHLTVQLMSALLPLSSEPERWAFRYAFQSRARVRDVGTDSERNEGSSQSAV